MTRYADRLYYNFLVFSLVVLFLPFTPKSLGAAGRLGQQPGEPGQIGHLSATALHYCLDKERSLMDTWTSDANFQIQNEDGTTVVNIDTTNKEITAGGDVIVNGDIKVTGLVDGVDVAAHAADSAIHQPHANKTLLDGVDQNLGMAASPTFAGLTVAGDIKTDGNVDGVDVSAHAVRHAAGGEDVLAGDLDANARVQVKIDGQDIGARRAVNLVAGDNVTLTAVDNPTTEEVAITLAAATGNSEQVPTSLEVEDLGSVVSSADIDDRFLFNDPKTGNTHLVIYYYVRAYNVYPFQVLDINLFTGQTRVIDAILGRPSGDRSSILHSNGKVYTGSTDPGYFFSYDPVTGEARQINKLADKGAQAVIEGDDGAIYIGEYTKGNVERYDPTTDLWENLGIMTGGVPATNQWVYTIGADTRYIYVANAYAAVNDKNIWYLVVYDRQEKTQTAYWSELSPTSVNVYPGMDNLWYVKMSSTSTGTKWYRLNGNILTEVSEPEINYDRMGLTSNYSRKLAEYQYEIDLADCYPYSGVPATIKWRPTGQTQWLETSGSLRTLSLIVKRLYRNGEQFLGFAYPYGPAFKYNPSTKTTKVLGRPQLSLYEALFFDTQKWYLAGYPQATMEFNPTIQWTQNETTTNLYDSSVNPHSFYLATEAVAKYYWFLADGADGCVYFGGHWERDGNGGSLGWYNPVSKETGGLREPFLLQDVCDLVSINNKRKIVYSSSALDANLDGKLFIFDTIRKQLENEFTPIAGETIAGKLAVVGDSQILGIVVNQTTGDKLYKADLDTKETLFVKLLNGKAFGGITTYDQRLVIGPDGFVWLYIDNYISRINPMNGNIEKIFEAAPAGNIIFYGNDLYIYSSYNLRRIKNIIGYLNGFSIER